MIVETTHYIVVVRWWRYPDFVPMVCVMVNDGCRELSLCHENKIICGSMSLGYWHCTHNLWNRSHILTIRVGCIQFWQYRFIFLWRKKKLILKKLGPFWITKCAFRMRRYLGRLLYRVVEPQRTRLLNWPTLVSSFQCPHEACADYGLILTESGSRYWLSTHFHIDW